MAKAIASLFLALIFTAIVNSGEAAGRGNVPKKDDVIYQNKVSDVIYKNQESDVIYKSQGLLPCHYNNLFCYVFPNPMYCSWSCLPQNSAAAANGESLEVEIQKAVNSVITKAVTSPFQTPEAVNSTVKVVNSAITKVVTSPFQTPEAVNSTVKVVNSAVTKAVTSPFKTPEAVNSTVTEVVSSPTPVAANSPTPAP